MKRSRIRRVEEQKAKKRIAKMIGASIVILFLLIFVGPLILVKVSIFFGDKPSSQLISRDTTIPFAPVIESLAEATSKGTLTISGYGESESKLRLFQNGDVVDEIIIDTDGNFSVSNISLYKGKNTFTAVITDTSGNTSKTSSARTIQYLKDSPRLEIAEPPDNKTVTDETIEILGQTDSNIQISINDRFVSVLEDGTFRFPFKLSDGENIIRIVATDMAENQTVVERKIKYEK